VSTLVFGHFGPWSLTYTVHLYGPETELYIQFGPWSLRGKSSELGA